MGIDFCNKTEIKTWEKLFEIVEDDSGVDIKSIYTYLCPVIMFICFFSIIFNAILISISRQSKGVNKKPVLLLSLNLAITDLIASLFNGLGILINSYLRVVRDLKISKCSMLLFEIARIAALVASALHLLALAFVHYRGIVNPLHYRSTIFFSQYLSRTINIISIACWILPLTIMIVWFSSTPCQGFQSDDCDYMFMVTFTYRYMVLTMFALPLLLMSFIYLRIFLIISRHQKGRRLVSAAVGVGGEKMASAAARSSHVSGANAVLTCALGPIAGAVNGAAAGNLVSSCANLPELLEEEQFLNETERLALEEQARARRNTTRQANGGQENKCAACSARTLGGIDNYNDYDEEQESSHSEQDQGDDQPDDDDDEEQQQQDQSRRQDAATNLQRQDQRQLNNDDDSLKSPAHKPITPTQPAPLPVTLANNKQAPRDEEEEKPRQTSDINNNNTRTANYLVRSSGHSPPTTQSSTCAATSAAYNNTNTNSSGSSCSNSSSSSSAATTLTRLFQPAANHHQRHEQQQQQQQVQLLLDHPEHQVESSSSTTALACWPSGMESASLDFSSWSPASSSSLAGSAPEHGDRQNKTLAFRQQQQPQRPDYAQTVAPSGGEQEPPEGKETAAKTETVAGEYYIEQSATTPPHTNGFGLGQGRSLMEETAASAAPTTPAKHRAVNLRACEKNGKIFCSTLVSSNTPAAAADSEQRNNAGFEFCSAQTATKQIVSLNVQGGKWNKKQTEELEEDSSSKVADKVLVAATTEPEKRMSEMSPTQAVSGEQRLASANSDGNDKTIVAAATFNVSAVASTDRSSKRKLAKSVSLAPARSAAAAAAAESKNDKGENSTTTNGAAATGNEQTAAAPLHRLSQLSLDHHYQRAQKQQQLERNNKQATAPANHRNLHRQQSYNPQVAGSRQHSRKTITLQQHQSSSTTISWECTCDNKLRVNHHQPQQPNTSSQVGDTTNETTTMLTRTTAAATAAAALACSSSSSGSGLLASASPSNKWARTLISSNPVQAAAGAAAVAAATGGHEFKPKSVLRRANTIGDSQQQRARQQQQRQHSRLLLQNNSPVHFLAKQQQQQSNNNNNKEPSISSAATSLAKLTISTTASSSPSKPFHLNKQQQQQQPQWRPRGALLLRRSNTTTSSSSTLATPSSNRLWRMQRSLRNKLTASLQLGQQQQQAGDINGVNQAATLLSSSKSQHQQLQRQLTGSTVDGATGGFSICTNTNQGAGGGGAGGGRHSSNPISSSPSYYEPTRKHLHAAAVPQTNTKAILTTLLILGTYFISYAPAIAYQVLTCIDSRLCPFPLYTLPFTRRILFGAITTLMLIAKSVIDPFIYSYRMSEIQTAINRYLSKRRSKKSQSAMSMQTNSQRLTNHHHHAHNQYQHQLNNNNTNNNHQHLNQNKTENNSENVTKTNNNNHHFQNRSIHSSMRKQKQLNHQHSITTSQLNSSLSRILKSSTSNNNNNNNNRKNGDDDEDDYEVEQEHGEAEVAGATSSPTKGNDYTTNTSSPATSRKLHHQQQLVSTSFHQTSRETILNQSEVQLQLIPLLSSSTKTKLIDEAEPKLVKLTLNSQVDKSITSSSVAASAAAAAKSSEITAMLISSDSVEGVARISILTTKKCEIGNNNEQASVEKAANPPSPNFNTNEQPNDTTNNNNNKNINNINLRTNGCEGKGKLYASYQLVNGVVQNSSAQLECSPKTRLLESTWVASSPPTEKENKKQNDSESIHHHHQYNKANGSSSLIF